MVAAEIGEAGRREPHAVEPALVEPMRRGFHGEVRDAVRREPVEGLVQGDGVGVVREPYAAPSDVMTPSVPRLALRRPEAAKSWRAKSATELLPLVPVTATIVSG
jgi:hypothetical protein